MRYLVFIYLWASLAFLSCKSVPVHDQEEIVVDLDDEVVRTIYNLQNSQNVDSLFMYFSDKKATYRYLAAMAFASIQSKDAIEGLTSLLYDKNSEVRTAAAYALGQTGDPSVVQSFIDAFDSQEVNDDFEFDKMLLESVGKCGDEKMLDFMATTNTYRLEDTNLLLGQALGIYRFSLRGIISEKGTKRMVEMTVNDAFDPSVRLIAAHYLMRTNKANLDLYINQLANKLKNETDPNIRMCLVNALAKQANGMTDSLILDIIKYDSDSRVRISGINGLSNREVLPFTDTLIQLLSDPNLQVALSAASVLNDKVTRANTNQLRDLAFTLTDGQVRAAVLGLALKSTPFYYRNTKFIINNEIERGINDSGTDHNKSFYIKALSEDPLNYQKIIDYAEGSNSPVLKTAAISALSHILSHPNFVNLYRTQRARNSVILEIWNYLKRRIDNTDSGEMAAAGEFLIENASTIKPIFVDSSYLNNVIDNLTPKNIEAKYFLERGLNAITERNQLTSALELSYHPIDWATLNNISDSPLAIIVTNKGRITVELYPNFSPATVSNFIDLVEDNYYDGKIFHRVVPNFVIQSGCPRGDGYGSSEKFIRSEFPISYYDQDGYLGMASIGKHTESVQWFITHRPTPHLDGRYSLFGKVTEGLDVLKNIQVGDFIQDIRVLKYN